MSGGGKIIEKVPFSFQEKVGTYTRYRVMTEYRKGWFDETFVVAEPSDDEPVLGDTIWWGAGQKIHWGDDDKKTLTKVGFSWSADRFPDVESA